MKNKNELFNYLLFGVLTTIVNIASFAVFDKGLGLDYKVATTIAWVLSVIFAFVTNKLYVFYSKSIGGKSVFREFISFLFFRGLSYVLDIASMIILIDFVKIDSLLAKIAANVMVVVFNYFASKYIIFKPSSSSEGAEADEKIT